jgi:diguanylate cyclase (GGDEF)-like protein/PAS domain S-box-containing protein
MVLKTFVPRKSEAKTMELKIAVIDDNPDDIFIIRRMLKKMKLDLHVVDFISPHEALAELAIHSVDCILLDFNFPEMNGLDFLKAFRKTISDTPIILLTGQGNEKIAVDALKNGAFDYLLKHELSEKVLTDTIFIAVKTRDQERILKTNHEFIKKLIDVTPVPLYYKDKNGVFLECNQAFEAFVGKCREDIIGKTSYEISTRDSADRQTKMDQLLLDNPGKQIYESQYDVTDQDPRYVVFNRVTYNNAKGEVEGIIGTITDITDLKRREAELSEKTFIDSLTGISNRRFFDEHIDELWSLCTQENEPLSLIMVDIDLFKNYNDYYGHQAGDRCLRKVAQAIQSALLRGTDVAIRYGGEEFLAVLPHTDVIGALEVAERIKVKIATLKIPHADSKVAKVVTVSQGIVEIKDPHDSVYEGLSLADLLLYQAKKNGRNRIETKLEK